jgi:hypothetical protein
MSGSYGAKRIQARGVSSVAPYIVNVAVGRTVWRVLEDLYTRGHHVQKTSFSFKK